MLKILLADDHRIFREGLKRILEERPGFVVAGEAEDGPQALDEAQRGDYDLMLLDISLPGMDGLEVLKQLRGGTSRLPVLILSMYPEEQYALRGLKAGADGYLAKESASEELVKAIEEVREGGKYITASIAERLATEVAGGIEKGEVLHEALSDREFQVMCLIGSGKRITDIAGELSLSVKTIWTYRSRILEKMGLRNNAEIIRYAIEKDLIR